MQDKVRLNQRQEQILELTRTQGFVATEAMVEQFDVTPQTIRRDINFMSDHGLLQRFHGGAGRSTSISNDPYDERVHSFSDAKRAIGAAVAAHIPNGSSLFLNIGTTTEMVATALLDHHNLRIVTNNINVAKILSQNVAFDVMVAGGHLRSRDGGIVGPAATEFIRQFSLDYGIIGVSGIDLDGSLLDFDYQETLNAEAIISNSHETVLVTDHSKFGRRAMTRFGHLSQIDWLYTDEPPPDPFDDVIRQAGTGLRICRP